MPKTNFQRGQRVPKEWFNAIQDIQFDGEDLDGHYPPLGDDSLSDSPGSLKPEFYGLRDAGKVTHVSALTVRIAALSVGNQNGTRTNIAETQITIADNATRVIFVDSNATLQSAGSAPETGVLLARVVTSGGTVSTITDLRERVNFQIKPISIPAVAQFVMPPGSVIEFAGSVAPSGWLLCDGSEVSRTTYADLFAAIGTSFGSPSSGSVFKLPDHRNRVGRGVGTGTDLGATGGADNVTLATNQMPLHSHSLTDPGHSHAVNDFGHSHGVNDPGHTHFVANSYDEKSGGTVAGTHLSNQVATDSLVQIFAQAGGTNISLQGSGSNVSVAGSSTGVTIGQAGGNTAVDIRNRFIGMNYLIKT